MCAHSAEHFGCGIDEVGDSRRGRGKIVRKQVVARAVGKDRASQQRFLRPLHEGACSPGTGYGEPLQYAFAFLLARNAGITGKVGNGNTVPQRFTCLDWHAAEHHRDERIRCFEFIGRLVD